MEHIRRTSKDLAKSFRRLRRRLSTCSTCIHYGDCPVMAQFKLDVQSAIHELSDEWSLDQVVTGFIS